MSSTNRSTGNRPNYCPPLKRLKPDINLITGGFDFLYDIDLHFLSFPASLSLPLALKTSSIRSGFKPSSISKKISAYIYEHPSGIAEHVQPQDKIVDRCALTIYPYSLEEAAIADIVAGFAAGGDFSK